MFNRVWRAPQCSSLVATTNLQHCSWSAQCLSNALHLLAGCVLCALPVQLSAQPAVPEPAVTEPAATQPAAGITAARSALAQPMADGLLLIEPVTVLSADGAADLAADLPAEPAGKLAANPVMTKDGHANGHANTHANSHAKSGQPQIQTRASQQVLIQNGRILRVAPAGTDLPLLNATERQQLVRLDGKNYFLTLGLMDSHVHLAVGGAIGTQPGQPDPFYRRFAQQQPRSYLYFGITQVVDLNGSIPGIQQFAAAPQAPDVFRCGAAPVAGGYGNPAAGAHPDYVDAQLPAGQSTSLPTGSASRQSTKPKSNALLPQTMAHAPQAVMARIKASGAHCLKLYIENGFGDASHLPLYSEQVLQQLVAAARQAQLPVFAHANALDMQKIALQHRVDAVAHGLWNWTGLTERDKANVDAAAGLPVAIVGHLKQLHQQHLGYQPTLGVMRHLATVLAGDDPTAVQLLRQVQPTDVVTQSLLPRVVPADLLHWYQTDAAAWFAQELWQDFGGLSKAESVGLLLRASDQGARAVRYLHQLGHPLVLASDTPSAPLHSQQPGLASYQELLALAAAGVPAADVFAAATINNARLLGIAGDYGSVHAGKVANLLLLKNNPLLDVAAWHSLDTVILRGQPIARQSLQAN